MGNYLKNKGNEEIKKIPVLFSKSNSLISSKSKMTLSGRKIFDAAIMNAKECVDEEGMPAIKLNEGHICDYRICNVMKSSKPKSERKQKKKDRMKDVIEMTKAVASIITGIAALITAISSCLK